jgi:hypothetical protein
MEINYEHVHSDMELFEERPELLMLQNSAYMEVPLPQAQNHIPLTRCFEPSFRKYSYKQRSYWQK